MAGSPLSQRLHQARRAAGLTQAELAKRAGTSQARVSSYERGAVVPTASTTERLLRAARPLPSEALRRHRHAVVRLARHHRVGNVRIFGSVARGDDTPTSDVDLLVTPEPDASLLDLSAFAVEVEDLVGCEVDVTSDRGLRPESPILRDARAL